MNLNELIKEYLNLGYDFANARAKVCQDIILSKIAKSSFVNNVTVKGGVVMHNISNDKRRSTRDIDLDFIRYSLNDTYIKKFINGLNEVKDDIKLEIANDKIEELNQQDYKGKRLELKITDKYNNTFTTKLDLGVHKNTGIEQEELLFSIDALNENVVLLANSKEQIFIEKLKSLLTFGSNSTRYKDILDFYYLINATKLDTLKLYLLMENYIFLNEKMDYQNIADVFNELQRIFTSKRYIKNFSNIKNNWLELPMNEVIDNILNFFETLNCKTVA